MGGLLEAAFANLSSPMILSFVLGLGAGLLRSDLSIPEAIGKGLAVYLMFAIGLKGGAAVAGSSLDLTLLLSALFGILLSFGLPFVAFFLLRKAAGVERITAAAVASHYGSISIVTFVTATTFLATAGIDYEGYLVAVVALMETPAIITGIWLARRGLKADSRGAQHSEVLREIFLNGSVVLLVGAFFIGWASGKAGLASVAPFFDAPFKGVLCLFLLDMGLLAAARLSGVSLLKPRLIAFGLYMPLIGAAAGLAAGWLAGLGLGGAMLLAVLGASASYIAVPAAMRLALPQANPGVYVTLSLAITFPFNVVVGIPLYLGAARLIYGA